MFSSVDALAEKCLSSKKLRRVKSTEQCVTNGVTLSKLYFFKSRDLKARDVPSVFDFSAEKKNSTFADGS